MDDHDSFELSKPIGKDAWPLDPGVVQLNHGSFGACPVEVIERQSELRRQMEAQPVRFLVRQLPALLDESRRALAGLIAGEPENLVFVTNATAGVNAVLRSLRFEPGDELLVTNHGYNACTNVARFVAERSGANVVVAEVPAPVASREEIVDAVLARVTARTRLALVDHITSPTAIVMPIKELVGGLAERGVDTLVDGAHAPGMIPLELKRLGAAYYAGNCHKWLCAPKGAGFLYVRPERQEGLQPPVISHGYNQPRAGYSRFQDAFDWQGTNDPTAWVCVGGAIRFLNRLMPGGIEALMSRNHALAVAASRDMRARLPVRPVCPDEMLGSMAALALPDSPAATLPLDAASATPVPRLGSQLLEKFGIEVPVYYWPAAPRSLVRVSAQAYNHLEQYARLAGALEALLAASG